MDTSSLDLDDSSVSLGNRILTPTIGRHNLVAVGENGKLVAKGEQRYLRSDNFDFRSMRTVGRMRACDFAALEEL